MNLQDTLRTPWTTTATATEQMVSNLEDGVAYSFEVRAIAPGGTSDPLTITATTKLKAPTGFYAYAPNPEEMNLYWQDNSLHETGFAIEYWVTELQRTSLEEFSASRLLKCSIFSTDKLIQNRTTPFRGE